MEADVQPVAPSATPVPAPGSSDAAIASGDFAAFEKAEHAKQSPTFKADPSPAKPVEQVDDKPAPSAEKKPRVGHVGDADTRVQELLAERAQLRRELELSKAPVTPKPPSEAARPAVEKFPEYAEYLTKNPDASFETWLDDRDDWRDARRDALQQARMSAEALHQADTERAQTFSSQIAEQTKSDPEFLSKVSPDVLELRPVEALGPGEKFGPKELIGSELLKSTVAPKLMSYWTEHPEELQRLETVPEHLRKLPTAERGRQYHIWLSRELGKLEASLERPSTTPNKTVTSAPAPPPTLGSRPALPADAEADAIKRGDFLAAQEIWRAQDAAKSSRR